MRRVRIMMGAAAASVLAGAASAAPDASADARFVDGDYAAAAEAAVAAGGAENLALAARAINAASYFEDDRKTAMRLADRAHDHAAAAIKIDPALTEAHLQAAIGTGLRSARMAPARALALNLPGRVRRNIDAALALEPDNPYVLSISAAWRMEVARRGGGIYGADAGEGYAEFVRARAGGPDNILVAYECALRVLASRRAEWRGFGLEALAAAIQLSPQTAFDRGIQARAASLDAAVKSGEKAEKAFIAAQP